MSPVSRRPPPSPQELSRRAALQLIAVGVASLAAACKEPDEKIVAQDTVKELPYVHLPEGFLPGIAKHYATTLPLGGYGRGAIVTAFEGRPTKVEGNPRHPASLGGTDVFAQAEILGLYDPDRSQTVRLGGEIADWPAFESAFRAQMGPHAADKGAGLRLLSGRITSPSLLDQIAAMKSRFPDLRWHRFEPAEDEDPESARAVYGQPLTLRPRLMDAAVVVAFDADPLGPGPEQAANARALASRRESGLRLYSAECAMTLTGAFADRRIAAHPDAIEAMIAALASRLGASLSAPDLQEEEARFVDAVAKALLAQTGGGLVLAGPSLSRMARALAVWINDRLAAPVDAFALSNPTSEAGTLAELAKDLQAGKVQTLLILDSNPVPAASGDLDFAALMAHASFRLHLGLYFDETAEASIWHLPAPHALESWSDLAAPDGTVGLVQPLIRPLHPSCSAHRLLALMSGEADRSDYDRLRDFWRGRWGGEGFENRWRKTLVDGVIEGSRPQPVPKPTAQLPDWTPRCAPGGLCSRLSPGSVSLRRAVREQRLASGMSAALLEGSMGQRDRDVARGCRPREDRGRRRGGDRRGRPVCLRAGASFERPLARRVAAVARLRAQARRRDRRWRRLQRFRSAEEHVALDYARRDAAPRRARRKAPAFHRRACSRFPGRRKSSRRFSGRERRSQRPRRSQASTRRRLRSPATLMHGRW